MLNVLCRGWRVPACHLGSVEEVSTVVELLQESSQWFSGGSKQMKVTLSHTTREEGKPERECL